MLTGLHLYNIIYFLILTAIKYNINVPDIRHRKEGVMAEYYRMIKGKKYDRELLDLADTSTRGRGDGRISLSDARRILKKVRDSNRYTDIEKRTISRIRDNYKFTSDADAWFRTEVRRWAASKKPAVQRKKIAAPRKKVTPAKRPVRKAAPAVIDEFPEVPAPPLPARPVTSPKEKSSIKWKILLLASAVIVAVLALMKLPQLKRYLPEWFPLKSEKPSVSVIKAPPKTGELPEEQIVPSTQEKKTVIEKAPAPPPEGSFYTVEPKDSLISIAEKQTGDYRNWVRLFQANRGIIKNPTLIFIGQKLMIPEELRAKKQ